MAADVHTFNPPPPLGCECAATTRLIDLLCSHIGTTMEKKGKGLSAETRPRQVQLIAGTRNGRRQRKKKKNKIKGRRYGEYNKNDRLLIEISYYYPRLNVTTTTRAQKKKGV